MKRLLIASAAVLALAACANDTRQPLAPAAAVAPSPAVSEAQSKLASMGFYSGPVDGIMGAETRLAVERYQASRGLATDGILGGATLATLRSDTGPAPRVAVAPPPPPPPPRAVPISDTTTVRTVQNRLKQLGYYDGPADGVWGPGTQVALERFENAKGLRTTGQLNTATLDAMGLNARDFPAGGTASATLEPTVVRAVQTRLRRDGYYRGGVDGTWGAGTQTAVERFQRAKGLEATGQLTPATISALGLDPNNLAQSAASSLGSGSSRRY